MKAFKSETKHLNEEVQKLQSSDYSFLKEIEENFTESTGLAKDAAESIRNRLIDSVTLLYDINNKLAEFLGDFAITMETLDMKLSDSLKIEKNKKWGSMQ